MRYYITNTPHYKGGTRTVLYETDSITDARKKARLLVKKQYMVDIWETGNIRAVGCIISTGKNIAYDYEFKSRTTGYSDVFKKVEPSGRLSNDITPAGVHRAQEILRSWY